MIRKELLDKHRQLLIQEIEILLEQFEENTNKQVGSISFIRILTGLKYPQKEIEYLVSAEVVEG